MQIKLTLLPLIFVWAAICNGADSQPLLATPTSASFASSGVYDIYSNGVKKGKSSYTSDAPGRVVLDGDSGLGAIWRGSVSFANGKITSADFDVAGVKPMKVAYTGKGDSISRIGPDGQSTQTVSAGTVLYYPMEPILLQRALSEYPARATGFQTLSALDMLTGKPRPISAELNHTEDRTIAGKPAHLRVWRINSAPSTEAVVYTDDSNRPLYWTSPAVQFEMSLQGFEELRPAYRYQSSVSQPQYRVKPDRDVQVPMSDGVKLVADVYRPDAPGTFPVLLQRTCYDRSEFGNGDGEFFAQRGYVYVTQHVRGRGNSEGEFTPFLHEAADGSDTIKWCASQPWSNGKVGMLGASYNGYCEWMAAKMQPPALKTMISTVPMPGPPDGAPWAGGMFYTSGMLSWYGLLREKARTTPFSLDMTASLNTLPIGMADSALFGSPIPSFQYWVDRDKYDASVTQGGYREEMAKIDVPVLHVSGWLDSVGVGTRLNYMQMVANGKKNQKLIWGPWSHFTNRESSVGEWDFGPESYIDLKTTYLRWFDRWLKDMHNGIDTEPAVSTYLLNEHRWEQSAEWPPSSLVPQRWYLHAPTGPKYSGVLSQNGAGGGSEPAEHYVYDLAKAVYSNTNQFSFFFGWLSGIDLSSLCGTQLRDRLLYQSEPLTKPLRLCGPIFGRLCAATSAEDTDWVVALLDVAPDGKSLGIACGAIRARFHASLAAPVLLTPNEPVTYDIDMWQTGVSVPAGHRLRIVVLSTLFPDTDRNLNTGGSIAHGTGIVVGNQTVFHERDKESYVVLPVVAAETKRSGS